MKNILMFLNGFLAAVLLNFFLVKFYFISQLRQDEQEVHKMQKNSNKSFQKEENHTFCKEDIESYPLII